MLARLLTLVFILVPVLSGQQRPQHQTFTDDCDKTARTQADLNECSSSDAKNANDD